MASAPCTAARPFREFDDLIAEVRRLNHARRDPAASELLVQAGQLFPRDLRAQLMTVEFLIGQDRDGEARAVLQRAKLLLTGRVHPRLRAAVQKLSVELAARERRAEAGPSRLRGAARAAPVKRPSSAPAKSASELRPTPAVPAARAPRIELTFRAAAATLDAPPFVGAESALSDYRLRLAAQDVARLQSFDTLLALTAVRGVDHYEYQLRTVRRVLGEFHGRALLADEVGLGKTVEAALCLKEYLLRGLVSRVLILVPPALRAQWRDELANKFGIEAHVIDGDEARRDPTLWSRSGVLLASLGLARVEPHASHIARSPFDLLIVDEAHRLKHRHSRSWQLVDRLRARFLLLLSATPVENDLIEIYNVLSLLKPGLFSTEAAFKRAFLAPGKTRVVKDPVRLRTLLREVMIRNTRALSEAKLPPRYATTLRAVPGADEAELLARVAGAVRGGLANSRLTRAGAGEILRAVGSSPRAAAPILARFEPELAERARDLSHPAKDALLAELLARRPGEKVLLFAAHMATLEHVAEVVRRSGRAPTLFHGRLSATEKEAAIDEFRETGAVLVSSESGGEGFNLQFARTIVNYDLPWNPMRIEQRIGRVHRIGQTREVFVFNLVTAGTIEEEILRVLDDKIAMFELVVGEVEAILGRLGDDEQEFQELVLELYTGAADAAQARQRFEALGERMLAARGEYKAVKELEEAAFGRDLEA
ncbi:MAG: DEAD/DEAH box helicase family protein [Planctomycetes bacterium]|nr:DEAD/DEAH box helicase family protein [Planctomycetota bacterium]